MDKKEYKYTNKKMKSKIDYIERIKTRNFEIQIMIDEINSNQQGKNEIQRNFNFKIPDYILDEMIKEKRDKENIIVLINLAVLNGTITTENGKKIKKIL